MWQSQTQFLGVKNPWVSYADEPQQRLEAAHASGRAKVVLTFNGESYIVNLKEWTQVRSLDPSKVRVVRRTNTERSQWILVSKSETADPILLNRADNEDIENGTSERF